MREIRTSGLMSGVGKRDDARRQHPRPTSTLPPVRSSSDYPTSGQDRRRYYG